MRRIHLFGGGPLVGVVASIAAELGWGVVWRTSPRLATTASIHGPLGFEGPLVGERMQDVMRLGSRPSHPNDIALSLGSPWIFTQDWLNDWSTRALNLHSTRLPRHRGGGGGTWQVLMQDESGAATLHVLRPGLDDGEIVAQRTFRYSVPMTAMSWSAETQMAAESLLRAELPRILRFERCDFAQPRIGSLYWPRVNSLVHGWIDWNWSGESILRFIAAFGHPHGGARTYLRGNEVVLREAVRLTEEQFHPFQTGIIVEVSEGNASVATTDGIIKTLSNWSQKPPRAGDRLHTPLARLDDARATRGFISPSGAWRFERAGDFEAP